MTTPSGANDNFADRARGVPVYNLPPIDPKIKLKLDLNEGPRPPAGLQQILRSIPTHAINWYPDVSGLEHDLAERFNVDPARVVCTGGLDDAIARLVMSLADQTHAALITTPTFAMIPHYLRISQAPVDQIPWWQGAFPRDQFIQTISNRAATEAPVNSAWIVTPNNPTGLTASLDDFAAVAESLRSQSPSGVAILDHAYAEFTTPDLTADALTISNAIVMRTFSKAWGLAGLRVGYAICPPEIAGRLRAIGQPFAVTAASAHVARAWHAAGKDEVNKVAQQVRAERARMTELLTEAGATCWPGEANFVLARFSSGENARAYEAALRQQGVAIRRFNAPAELDACVRITCPASAEDMQTLEAAMREAASSIARSITTAGGAP